MKWKICLVALLLPAIGHALNITGAYANDGGDKIPRDCFYPHCVSYSSSTINRFWDGKNITPFTGEGDLTHFQVIAINNTGSDATNVTVNMSSLTCGGNTGIVNTVTASSLTVTSLVGRPIRVYSAWYVQNLGMSSLPYGRSEFEARQYPTDMQVPCTVNVNNDCIPNGGTDLWVNRTMNNLFLPVAWIPNEEFAPVSTSSYTVYHSSSMAWDVDVWTSSTIPAGTCTGTFSIFEGASLSTAMPVSMQVYDVDVATAPGMNAIVDIGNTDLNNRINGNGSPSLPVTGNYLSSRQQMAQLFKENGIQVQGDAPDVNTNDYWSLEYSSNISGATFTPALGYDNAPGAGTPNSTYIIGFYGSWKNSFSTGSVSGSTDFCLNVSSWLANCQAAGVNCVLYTPLDETTPANLSTEIASMTWTLQNNPRCSFGGKTMSFMQTDGLPDIVSSAPYTSLPTSTLQSYSNFAPSSVTWQVQASSIMAGNGSAGSNGQVWRYNEAAIGAAPLFPYEEEGYTPQVDPWAYWKKLCPNGNCSHMGYMIWEGNYWSNTDNGGGCGNGGLGGGFGSNQFDIYHNPCTFGYNTGSNAQWGTSGFSYCQGDGVLSFYGSDQVGNSIPFGVNGAFPTYTLKQLGVGLDTVKYINAAYLVNPSSTTALVNSMFPKALWEVTCFNPTSDCTYSYGPKTWNSGSGNAWTLARESLLEIAAGIKGPIPPNDLWNGKSRYLGKNNFR